MKQVSKEQFESVLASVQKENAERAEMGLRPHSIETKDYPAIGHAGSLTEYYWAGTMFGFIQNGIHYTNGI